jgi:P-type conjugative transfer protein TrbJ
MKLSRILAAKFAFLISSSVWAGGILVYDGLNNIQTTITAIEDVTQTAQMVDAYKTQLEQLGDQKLNSLAPPTYLWDQADRTLDSVLKAVDAVTPMIGGQGGGGLDGYLNGFKGLDSYSSEQMKQCYQVAGCVATANQQAIQAQDTRSQQQVLANQAALRSVMEQQQLIMNDAKQLRYLQQNVQGAQGRMAAIQAGNQLMSAQANNLLQLRTILTTQQQMQAAQAQAQTENDAQLKARNRQILRMPDQARSATNGEKF